MLNGKPGRTGVLLVRRPRRKEQTPIQMLCAWLVEHQIGEHG